MGGHLQPWDGKSPLSIAAALLLLVTSLPRATQHPSAAAIAAASGVAEVRDAATQLIISFLGFCRSPYLDDLCDSCMRSSGCCSTRSKAGTTTTLRRGTASNSCAPVASRHVWDECGVWDDDLNYQDSGVY
jgi:hypothetical protein